MATPRLAIFATIALSALVALPALAHAQDRSARDERFSQLDTDKSGTVSLEEFLARRGDFLSEADTDDDGSITAAEIADAMERRRNLRRAERMIERMDMDGDGKLTMEEIDSRGRKRFALLDVNDDGEIAESEARRMGKRHGMRGGHKNMRHGRDSKRRGDR